MANQDYENPLTTNRPGESMTEKAESTAAGLKDKASEASARARAGLDDAMKTGRQKADQARMSTAGGLEKAASKVHETAERLPGGEKTQRAAHAVASGMERSASYLREHEFREMMSDAEEFVRRHPGQSLIAAVAAGFLLGQAMRRSRH
jgi:ElaB/YqjD/DUF883 family membrane-anchored ribosome-binding protein